MHYLRTLTLWNSYEPWDLLWSLLLNQQHNLPKPIEHLGTLRTYSFNGACMITIDEPVMYGCQYSFELNIWFLIIIINEYNTRTALLARTGLTVEFATLVIIDAGKKKFTCASRYSSDRF